MHGLLEPDARFVGPARHRGRLLDLGAFPGVVAAVDGEDVVQGELFELTTRDLEAALDRLDRYEGDLFRRESLQVEGPHGPTLAWVYRYLGDPGRGRLVASGDWLSCESSVRIARAP
jgi:gamma-glutamylcyclotransferase (GGCT)/AIG2-like uncharacterized protein YtfP